jgi:hypothetical protein
VVVFKFYMNLESARSVAGGKEPLSWSFFRSKDAAWVLSKRMLPFVCERSYLLEGRDGRHDGVNSQEYAFKVIVMLSQGTVANGPEWKLRLPASLNEFCFWWCGNPFEKVENVLHKGALRLFYSKWAGESPPRAPCSGMWGWHSLFL